MSEARKPLMSVPEVQQTALKAVWKKIGVCNELCDAAMHMRWHQPTEIQEQAIPLLLEGAFYVSVRAHERMRLYLAASDVPYVAIRFTCSCMEVARACFVSCEHHCVHKNMHNRDG
jgi:hypothetical protein